MSCPDRNSQQAGQALIVVLLVSAIGLTLGLSLAARSTEETNISTEIEASTRAFSAAEAGLEESVQNIGKIGFTSGEIEVGDGAKYDVGIQDAGNSSDPFRFPGEINNNQPLTIWLVGHKREGDELVPNYDDPYGADSLTICWGKEGGDSVLNEAAMEFTLYYTDSLKRAVYNPSSASSIVSGATGETEQASAAGDSCGGGYKDKAELNFNNMKGTTGAQKVFLRVRPIIEENGKTRIGVEPAGVDLPSQGELHVSTGKTDSGQKTKLVQFISHPAPPEIFDTILYSESALGKQIEY